jgi:hypothetical protein
VGLPNALVQLQAHYHHCGEAASEKCLSAATFVRRPGHGESQLPQLRDGKGASIVDSCYTGLQVLAGRNRDTIQVIQLLVMPH